MYWIFTKLRLCVQLKLGRRKTGWNNKVKEFYRNLCVITFNRVIKELDIFMSIFQIFYLPLSDD